MAFEISFFILSSSFTMLLFDNILPESSSDEENIGHPKSTLPGRCKISRVKVFKKSWHYQMELLSIIMDHPLHKSE